MSHAGPKTARYLPAWFWVVGGLLVTVLVIWLAGTVIAAVIPKPGTQNAAESRAIVPSVSSTPSATPTPMTSPSPSIAPPVTSTSTVASGISLLSSDDVATIEGAVSTDDLDALTPYLGSSVLVVVGGGGSSGSMSPAGAIAQLQTMGSTGSTWNFALDSTTLTHYRQGSYGSYFPSNAMIGKSSDGHIVSLLPRGHNLATIFMISDDILLVSN